MTDDPRRGCAVVIVGPDGAGKTTLADALEARLETSGPVVRAHLSPPVLPRRSGSAGPVTEPHAAPAHRGPVALAKLLYLFLDFLLAWRFTIPRLLRHGSWVIVERGWWDLVIDPRRYRLLPGRLARQLGRLIPEPDLTVLLDGPPAILFARKPELPLEEIGRQIQMARTVLPPSARVIHLDASLPVADLVESVMKRLETRLERSGESRPSDQRAWVHLPPKPLRSRIIIPRTPRRAATAGLRTYHPVTRFGYVASALARPLAALGAAALLPPGNRPAELGLLDEILPPSSTYAVRATRQPTRSTAVCLGPDGKWLALAKLAIDDPGQARLEHEASMARALSPHLRPPLSSPAIVAQGDGYLLFEPVIWRARWSAWRLPEEVAWAMGSLYRAGVTGDDGRGFAHGDFAPWNLLRTGDGWALIDWADGRLDALPFRDVFHYIVQASVLLGRPRTRELLAALLGAGPTARPFAAYADGAGLAISSARDFLPDYLQTSHQHLLPGRDKAPGLAIRRRLLRELRHPEG